MNEAKELIKILKTNEADNSFVCPVNFPYFNSNDAIALGLVDKPEDFEIVRTKKVNLKWELEFEMRDYGIKAMYVTVPDQEFDIEYEVIVNQEGDTETKQAKIKVKNVKVEYNSESFRGVLFPYELDVYTNKGKIEWTATFTY